MYEGLFQNLFSEYYTKPILDYFILFAICDSFNANTKLITRLRIFFFVVAANSKNKMQMRRILHKKATKRNAKIKRKKIEVKHKNVDVERELEKYSIIYLKIVFQ